MVLLNEFYQHKKKNIYPIFFLCLSSYVKLLLKIYFISEICVYQEETSFQTRKLTLITDELEK